MDKTTENIHGARVGDYLTDCWGYDQTNIDIYKVVKATRTTVVVVAVDSRLEREGTNHMRKKTFDHGMNGYYIDMRGIAVVDRDPAGTFNRLDASCTGDYR